MKQLFKPKALAQSIGLVGAIFSIASSANEIPETVITADFRGADIMTLGTSVTVITPDVYTRRDARHLEDLLTIAPNVNFAAGASRGRFVQIRGIGERSQFKDPLDPSVGLIIDGAI